ncbi:hypothetical protein RYX36_027154, partial [Vicia faba]
SSRFLCVSLKRIIPSFELAMEEIKELGFDPSKYNFYVALLVKRAISKSQWDAKVNALKSWGCSQDVIFYAVKKLPNFMLRSPEKLNAVMWFWVKELGWDPSLLLAAPDLFGFSIEKRFIPRASVVRYLLSNGLMKNNASLVTPFYLSDELFMQRYVKRFEDEASMLLKLYQGFFLEANSSLDDQLAHWCGLNPSQYQWTLDDYKESRGMVSEINREIDKNKN